jgi:NADH-quinone oxidoreductase subunit M
MTGHWSFALSSLYGMTYLPDAGRFAFAAFALAFAIKAAMFPLHTWLPDAYGEAPAPVTFLLSAVMSKLGLYGFLRVALPLFPHEAHYFQPVLIGLAVTGVIYAALIALVQDDAKRVIAYASVSHLGIILLAIFTLSPQALSGSVLHMVAHALTTGALFLMVGFLYERKGTTLIAAFGGITKSIPFFAGIFMLITLASVGLPGLAGFVGEFLIFLGAFGAHPVPASIATISVILGASYMLWMFQRVMFGPLTSDENRRLPDLSGREGLALLPIVALVIFIGLSPQFLLGRINPSITTYLTLMKAPAATAAQTPNQPTRQATASVGGVR